MKEQQEQWLTTLFERWSGEKAISLAPLPPSGSPRQYYRITGQHATAIGVFNPDPKENLAFLTFSKHFRQNGLPVPEIYAEDLKHNIYLLQDLGDTTLFSYVIQTRAADAFPENLLQVYKRVIEYLPQFQISAGNDLDYTVCYPRAWFDLQSMLWDLNYFKYYFIRLAQVSFDEQQLEDDFQTFARYLLQAPCDFFLYRDFQSRNIMLVHDDLYFIDYQGGRKGALQYDLASLLYDAKANLPHAIRTELLHHYLNAVNALIPIDDRQFFAYFYGYALMRIMQAMGAYGLRGFYERKEHFLYSIPYALNNLQEILERDALPLKIPMLTAIWRQLIASETLKNLGNPTPILCVQITSFSYKRGIPVDASGHGGGYVFDCRALPNPGRYAQYQHLTGKDADVITFLEAYPEIQEFLKHVYALIDQSVEDYQRRKRTHLMINFGCTGGRHRSVYCAEMLAKHIPTKYRNVTVILHHLEQE